MKEKLELQRLSQVFAETPDIKSDEREKLYPGYYSQWCSFQITKYQLALQDAIVLLHGPQGCVGNTKAFLSTYVSQYFGSPHQYSPTTDMRQTDVFLGAADKLQAAILEADREYKPKIIFLMVTCCAGIIKEPVEEVAASVQSEVGAKIVIMRVEGFKHYCGGWMRPYVSEVVARLMEPPAKKIPRSVNILGVSKEVHSRCGKFPMDSNEMERLLDRVGLSVHSVLLQGARYEDIRSAPEAEFNALDCPEWGMPYAERMEREWGVPYGKSFLPIGVDAISRWLMEIGEHFGLEKETRQVVKEESDRIMPLWEQAKRMVEGKIAFLDGGEGTGNVGKCLAWSRMCAELGMRPIIFNIAPVEIKGTEQHVKFNLREKFDPEVVAYHYTYHRRLSAMDVIEGLGLDIDDVAFYTGDVFPDAIADWDKPIFDPSNSPRVVMATHCARHRGGPGRRVGFRGAERVAMDVIQSVRMATRKNRPTLQGRLVRL